MIGANDNSPISSEIPHDTRNLLRGFAQLLATADPIAARDHLAELVGTPQGKLRTGHVKVSGPTMRCRSAGGAGGTRTAAFCVSPKSGDLSCAMVRDGYAAKWDRYWQGHRCP